MKQRGINSSLAVLELFLYIKDYQYIQFFFVCTREEERNRIQD
jgi:hypothetical protein